MSGARTIGKLAKAVGVNVETIRFYEREGLIAQPRKGEGPRHYDDHALATLRYIRLAQQLGLSLKDIRALQGRLAPDAGFCAALRETVEHKLVELERQASEIARLRGELQAFLDRCRAHDPKIPCPIVEELTALDFAVGRAAERRPRS